MPVFHCTRALLSLTRYCTGGTKNRTATGDLLGRIENHSISTTVSPLGVSGLSNSTLGRTVCGRGHLRFVNRNVHNVSVVEHNRRFVGINRGRAVGINPSSRGCA